MTDLRRRRHSPDFEPAKSQRVEGRVTRILYVGPPDRSPLEIVRNYELELKKNGFETYIRAPRRSAANRMAGSPNTTCTRSTSA